MNKNWLKKAFFNNDVEDTSVSVQTPAQSTPVIATPQIRSTPVMRVATPAPVQQDTNELDESYINHLFDFMEKNNQAGPDYLEFARSLDEMISEMGDGVSEEKIFQMTYKVGYKQSLPVQKLIETANIYINLFNQHKKEYDVYLNDENQKNVGSRVNENNKLTTANNDSLKKINELKNQIATLEAGINNNNVKIDENNNIIDTETATLESKKIKFDKAFNFVVSKISDDIEKIKKHLTNIK